MQLAELGEEEVITQMRRPSEARQARARSAPYTSSEARESAKLSRLQAT